MDREVLWIVAVIVLVSVIAEPAWASSACPANQPTYGPYRKVEITPKYKYVGQEVSIRIVRVDNKVETPLRTSVTLEYKGDGIKVLKTFGPYSTNSNGIVKFTPDQPGKYTVKTGSTNPTSFEVRETSSVQVTEDTTCGNEECEAGESPENCPEDCVYCGDGFCEGNEDKVSCPEDCMVCGDGVCDDAEIGATQCFCAVDCLVCGDGICRDEYGEHCPADCPHQAVKKAEGTDLVKLLEENWWIIVVVAVALAVFVKRRPIIWKIRSLKSRKKKGKSKYTAKPSEPIVVGEEAPKAKVVVKPLTPEVPIEDEEIEDLIAELLDTGVSEKQVKKKLKQFGLEDDEIKELIGKGKKLRET